MSDRIQEFLTSVSDMLLSADTDGLLKCLRLPLAVYSAAGVAVVSDRPGLQDLLRSCLEEMRQHGVTKSTPVLTDLRQRNSGSIEARLRCYLANGKGVNVCVNEDKFFLRDTADGLKVEMVEHSRRLLDFGNSLDGSKPIVN